jgi:hypothetical protein
MTLREVLSSGLFLQSFGIVGLLFRRKAAPAEPAPKSAPEAESPAEQTREALRRNHMVHLIEKQHEGFALQHVPAGTYGWTYAPAAAAPLFAVRTHGSFEMHKAADGTAYVVGFVSRSELAGIEANVASVELKLFPAAYGDASELVSLPLARVKPKSRQLSFEPGNPLAITVLPG